LCRHLAQGDCDIRILTTNANGPQVVLNVPNDQEVQIAEGVRGRYCHRQMRSTVSLKLLRLLPMYIHRADVVHLTAVYSFPTIPTLLTCRLLNKPVVWSPRGALQRWKGSTRIQLKAVWEWACGAIAPNRLVLHVTSEEEARDSLKRFPGVKTVIIPNGIDIPEKKRHVPANGVVRLLYLGRLHPIKGIEILLASCKTLNDCSFRTWSLTIAGAGDPQYVKALNGRIKDLQLIQQVKMLGEVHGEAKETLFDNADIVVVPSHTESFGMVIAEALAHGVPVIASKGTPWKRLEEIGCGLWVENNPESLAKAIEQMSRMPLHEMGQRGREWMEKEFTWKRRASEMIACYTQMATS
jgi:glycosyltransferase involved in cell wall biosynthesis